MKKRVMTNLLICALMALGVGCDSQERIVPGQPVRVVLWEFGGLPGMQEWVKAAVERFNAERDDIHIELEFRDWATQRESLISTTILGDGPDIVRVHHKYSVEFGELGGLYALENFDDFPSVRNRILDNVWDPVSYGGKHYGVPVTMLPFILAVNLEILVILTIVMELMIGVKENIKNYYLIKRPRNTKSIHIHLSSWQCILCRGI